MLDLNSQESDSSYYGRCLFCACVIGSLVCALIWLWFIWVPLLVLWIVLKVATSDKAPNPPPKATE